VSDVNETRKTLHVFDVRGRRMVEFKLQLVAESGWFWIIVDYALPPTFKSGPGTYSNMSLAAIIQAARRANSGVLTLHHEFELLEPEVNQLELWLADLELEYGR